MDWQTVEETYGKDMAEIMKDSPYLRDLKITGDLNSNEDIPEADLDLAYRWALNRKPEVEEID